MAPRNTPIQTPAAAAPTPARRGRRPGQPAKEYNFSGLSADFLGRPMAVTAEIASKAAPKSVRDERQVAMDRIVKALHTDWQNGTVRNGDGTTTQTDPRSNKWSKMPKASYHVDPQVAETVKMLVRRAADFHGVAAKFGNAVRDAQGREIVVFAIRDRKVRENAETPATSELAPIIARLTEFFGDNEEAIELLARLVELSDESDDDSDDENGESPEA